MTKYIRTNEGAIYKIEDDKLIFDGNKIPVDINKLGKDYKVAGTIEELCDCFVLVDETLPPHLDNDLKEITMYKTYIAGSRGDIFGAIWVEVKIPNGKSAFKLEPVAIFEKGELELI